MNKAVLTILCVAVLAAAPASGQDQSWNRTLEHISSAVVSIRVDSTRAFDTERNQSSQATGFVVDAERGLILTNRPRRDTRTGSGAGDISESGGSRPPARVPRPGA